MKLSPLIQISVPPGLEGGELTVRMRAAGHETLRKLVEELAGALEKRAMKEVFALLKGGDDAGV